jgi:D-arginine dehydrogenase
MKRRTVAVVGAGIAGASLAAEISADCDVVVLEAEDHPGYHTTGRSNAFWQATYGGPGVEPLTTASFDWLHQHGFLQRRGALIVGRAKDQLKLEAFAANFADTAILLDWVNQEAIGDYVPGVRSGWDRGLFEDACFDIDVAALHAAYLRKAKANGADFAYAARVSNAHHDGNVWHLTTPKGTFSAQYLVNAAGAWADDLALLCGAKPLGIKAYRRTMLQLVVENDVAKDLPLTIDVNGTFYFRPENGRVWLSPHDESPSEPCDAAPEEIDIAHAIDRFEKVVDWPVVRLDHAWAGLRSFAQDRLPVFGFDAQCPAFFWCAGQGGFGIQTAPAAAKLCASLFLGIPADPIVAAIAARHYAPGRFD